MDFSKSHKAAHCFTDISILTQFISAEPGEELSLSRVSQLHQEISPENNQNSQILLILLIAHYMAFCNGKMGNSSKIGKFCKISMNFDEKPLSRFTNPLVCEGIKSTNSDNTGQISRKSHPGGSV